jgi:5-methyltetrahydropteroyltriglutamate--homocysteine methyltransferase
MKKLLPTSTAGSLPKPSWLAEPEKLWSPWKLQNEELADGKRDALRLSLQEQQHAGIDIVSDGEQSRQHFVTTFIEHLDGVDFEKRATVRIRDRYDASVPTVVGPVSRQKAVFVEDARFLRQQTQQPIKWALPGPMTMIDTLHDAHYKSREKLAWEFAKILNQEARELEAAGVDIIQFDEPAFNVFFDEVNDWGIATLGKGPSKVSSARPPCTSATAMASRPTRTGRRRWDRSGGSTSVSSRNCKPPTSAWFRWSATTRACRWR